MAACLWLSPVYKYLVGSLALLLSLVFSLRLLSNEMSSLPTFLSSRLSRFLKSSK